MKVTSSICGDCTHFDHDCNRDEVCTETCDHNNAKVKETFYATDKIENCVGFNHR